MNLVKYFSDLMEPVPLNGMQTAVITASLLRGWGSIGMCAVTFFSCHRNQQGIWL